MNVTQTYKDLRAWQVSVDLVEAVYKATEHFPRTETFGLVSQMRRAAVSISANIAEGNSRQSLGAYVNHLAIALGSVGELRTLIEISRRLQFLQAQDLRAPLVCLDECGRLVSGLRAALKKRQVSGPLPES